MDFSQLSDTAFISPDGSNRDAVARLLHQIVDELVTAATTADQRSPLPEAVVDAVAWPRQAVPWKEMLAQVRSHLTSSMNPAHPGYIGHMDSIPTAMSIVGDALVAALNNNMLSVEMSPVFSRLEPLVLRHITQLFGLGPQAGGVLVSGGSLANFQALTVARNQAFGSLRQGLPKGVRPVFFVSEVAHTSFKKAAMLMGLGTDAAIAVATNADSQIDLDDLQTKLARAQAAGQTPFALVATAGTTVTGNIDPIVAMAEVARAQGLWFHVDAAYGGAVAFSERHRHRLAGIEQADSVTFNPQKWLYVTKTCAIVMFRQFDLLEQHFRVLAPYMHDHDDWLNLGEFTVQGTRHPDILKLWLSLQHLGQAGYGAIVDYGYELTRHFVKAVQARPFLTLASQPEMNLVCFRGEPPAVPPDRWDSWNQGLQQQLTDWGDYFLSLPVYRDQRWLKAVLLNPYTTAAHIDALFEQIDRYGASHGLS